MLKRYGGESRPSSLSCYKPSHSPNTPPKFKTRLPPLTKIKIESFSNPLIRPRSNSLRQTKPSNLPLADMRTSSTNLINLDTFRSHDPTDIPELLPLPNVDSSSFNFIFDQKITACTKICSFAENIDENQSIERKTQYLSEFNKLFMGTSNQACKLSDEQFEKLYDMITKNFNRRIPSIMPAILSNDDVSPLVEPAWSHLNLVYQLLSKIIFEYPDALFISFKTIADLLRVAHSCDNRERQQISTLIPQVISFHLEYINETLNEFTSLINEYLDGAFPPCIVSTILQSFIAIIKVSEQIDAPFIIFFRKVIITLLGDRYYSFYEQSIKWIINFFIDDDSRNSIYIVNNILKYWPITKLSKQESFLLLLTKCIPKLPRSEVQRHIPRIVSIFSEASDSVASKVAEASFSIWTAVGFDMILQDNAQLVVNAFLPHILNAHLYHWSSGVRENSSYALSILQKWENKIITQNHTSTPLQSTPKENPHLKGWVLLARQAALFDKEIDLGKTLLLITTTFQEQGNSTKSQTFDRKTRARSRTLCERRLSLPKL